MSHRSSLSEYFFYRLRGDTSKQLQNVCRPQRWRGALEILEDRRLLTAAAVSANSSSPGSGTGGLALPSPRSGSAHSAVT